MQLFLLSFFQAVHHQQTLPNTFFSLKLTFEGCVVVVEIVQDADGIAHKNQAKKKKKRKTITSPHPERKHYFIQVHLLESTKRQCRKMTLIVCKRVCCWAALLLCALTKGCIVSICMTLHICFEKYTILFEGGGGGGWFLLPQTLSFQNARRLSGGRKERINRTLPIGFTFTHLPGASATPSSIHITLRCISTRRPVRGQPSAHPVSIAYITLKQRKGRGSLRVR